MNLNTGSSAVAVALFISLAAFAGCSEENKISPTFPLTASPTGSGTAGSSGTLTVEHGAGVAYIQIIVNNAGPYVFPSGTTAGPAATSTTLPVDLTGIPVAYMVIGSIELYSAQPGTGVSYTSSLHGTDGSMPYQFSNYSYDSADNPTAEGGDTTFVAAGYFSSN